MTLNEFLAKASSLFGFAEKAEKHFEAAQQSNARITELEGLRTADAEEIKFLKSEIERLKIEAKTAADNHAKALADKEAEVEKRAGDKAAQIVASQGVTAVKDTKPDASAGGAETYESVQKQLVAEKDPTKRAELAQKCRELRGHGDIFKK